VKREIELCILCDEPILPGERVSPTRFNGREVHHECAFREIAGGANHILRLCTCCGGSAPPDPPGMSKREAACWAFKVFGWVEGLREVMGKEKGPRDGGPLS
jgi:hypothetical protein